MNLQDELTSVHDTGFTDPRNVQVDARQRFWRIVGQVKRMDNPNENLILKVTEVRDCLYDQRLGGQVARMAGVMVYRWNSQPHLPSVDGLDRFAVHRLPAP